MLCLHPLLGLHTALVLLTSLAPTNANANAISRSLTTLPLWLQARSGASLGAKCNANSDCYTDYCQDLNCKVTPCHPVCHYAPAAATCKADDQCVSRRCSHGKCEYSALDAYCEEDWDCEPADASPQIRTCQHRKCKTLPLGQCTASTDCTTGHCIHGMCSRLPQRPNAVCSQDSECLTGECLESNSCLSPNGTQILCQGDSFTFCSRFPLGHSCENNGECTEGFCRSGKCVDSQEGDLCHSEDQCTGSAVCGTDGSSGKCHTPQAHSVSPQHVCRADSQCQSSSCVSSLGVTDQWGVELPYSQDLPEQRKCDYLDLGSSACRTFIDCKQGLCKAGKCQMGADGDRCFYNAHCESNVCGANGICQRPASNHLLGVGAPCSTNAQCLTGSCHVSQVTRPYPYNTSILHTVDDVACLAADAGGACHLDSDCDHLVCRSGKCTTIPNGQPCTEPYHCASNYCSVPLGGSSSSSNSGPHNSSKICQLAITHNSCGHDDQCMSGHCELEPCAYGDASECGDIRWCAPVPTLGTCRSDLDCNSYNAVCSTSEHKCVKRAGKTCKTSAECESDVCTKSRCGADPSPTKSITFILTTFTSTASIQSARSSSARTKSLSSSPRYA
ncbi:hypothetical protein OC846_005459 [Tilletia horrida]|uniref:Uncharacterized protein n=1 Tax=Tilletia horrida TaxID=155126 RepID=A0AAN6GNA5_9BASI|nr:hypothetical protein OC846_005459 [Tilletia horrida]